MDHDWYRNESWTSETRRAFLTKLKRARSSKSQYLVIQAGILIQSSDPQALEGALELTTLFFTDAFDPFFASNAHLVRAQALWALSRHAEAVDSFEAALQARRVTPNVKNDAHIEYLWAVACSGARDYFDQALAALKEFQEQSELSFPINAYHYFGGLALLHDALNDHTSAAAFAKQALAAAADTSGPFARHRDFGVVRQLDPEVQQRLWRLAAA